jgi:hypothetical protein
MNTVDVILLHGIQKDLDEESYYSDFVYGIRKYLPISTHCAFHPLNWNKLIQDKEIQAYKWMEGLFYDKLRRFGCTMIGDVIAYAPPESVPKPGDVYYDVNKLIEKTYDEIQSLAPKSKKAVFAHSMGAQIAFSLAFRKPFDLLITFGAPLLYFSLRFNGFGEYPHKTLGKMMNLYNKFDPVSTIVSRNPKLTACKDVDVTGWNPLNMTPLRAHTSYWKSDKVHRIMAQEIEKLSR